MNNLLTSWVQSCIKLRLGQSLVQLNSVQFRVAVDNGRKQLHCFDEIVHKVDIDVDDDIDLDVDFDVDNDVDLEYDLDFDLDENLNADLDVVTHKSTY